MVSLPVELLANIITLMNSGGGIVIVLNCMPNSEPINSGTQNKPERQRRGNGACRQGWGMASMCRNEEKMWVGVHGKYSIYVRNCQRAKLVYRKEENIKKQQIHYLIKTLF